MIGKHRLILASASPRRAELLSRLGFDFDTLAIDYAEAETPPEENGRDPAAFALAAAETKLEKARAALAGEAAVVICADTVVAVGGRIFGKPAGAGDARRMLRALSGVTHQVHTGVAVGETPDGPSESFVETTDVEFAPLSDEWIEAYIATGEPFDKAGAYGIQGLAGAFVSRVSGCFPNVVGLPAGRLARLLDEKFNASIVDFWRETWPF